MIMVFQRKKNTKKSLNDIKQVSGEVLPPKKEPHRFKPGNKLGGRPKGSRNRFAEQFFLDFHADWLEHGEEALTSCRKEDPATYCRIAASLIPKELTLKDGDSAFDAFLDQLTDEQIQQFIDGITTLGSQAQSKGSPSKALPRA